VRVLVLTADFPPDLWSGIGAAVEEQVHALGALGVDVTVLAPDAQGRRRAASAVPLFDAGAPRFPLEARQYDTVHLHSLALAPLALELRRRYGTRLVYTAHMRVEDELPPGATRRFWASVQQQVFRASRRVVFASACERASAVQAHAFLGARSVVVPHGIRRRAGLTRGRPSGAPLVFAGRFAGTKGLPLLAAIAPRLLAEYPGPLVLAGGHGDTAGEEAVRRLRRECGARCRVVGWLPRAPLGRLLRAAGLVLVPSVYEPFGLVALEAMSVGAPVVASAVGGLREVVAPGSGGRLVEPPDEERWTAAVLALLADKAARETLSERGPAYVAARFDAAAQARRLVEEAYAA
jgi:glycogen(starch) synthase